MEKGASNMSVDHKKSQTSSVTKARKSCERLYGVGWGVIPWKNQIVFH